MSVKTIYTCDKCGAEQLSAEQFWTVGVWAIHSVNNLPTNPSEFVQNKSMQVCRPCLELLGIHVKTKPGAEIATPPTVEELIREILERAQQ